MTSLVDALYLAKYNPFKYGEFLTSFYSELRDVEGDLLLSQLVIPLCSHSVYQGKIARAMFGDSKKSTIWTIFEDRARLYDLQERIDDFKVLTDQSLQYCLVNDWLEIDQDKLKVAFNIDNDTSFVRQKSAANLGRLFSNLSVVEIYAFLGVKPR